MAPINRRELAHRLFAAEFNSSRFELKGSADERSPNYLLSPLGAKANRVFFAGVLTDVETVGESGDLRRARVSDPTGLFTVYAGQYQPEASAALADLEPPQYVAVVGKTRAYEPEPGRVLASVRAESVTVVDDYVRNHWVLETAQRTRERLRAFEAALETPTPTPSQLESLGVKPHLVEGAILAAEKYQGDVDRDYFRRMVQEAVNFLSEGESPTGVKPPVAPVVKVQSKAKTVSDEWEKNVLSLIGTLASKDDRGAQWDLIVNEGAKLSLTEDQIEEALNSLMDKGVIYEPILGRLKLA